MSFVDWIKRLWTPVKVDEFGPPDPAPAIAEHRSTGNVTPLGIEYEPEKLPGPARFKTTCDFVAYCREMLPRVGLPGPAVDLFTAHLGRESGFGKNTRCYNFANIRVFASGTAAWYRHTDGLPYRAYLSGAEGLRDAVDFIIRNKRYAHAYELLLAGSPLWYSELGIAGFYQTHDPVTHAIVDVTRENVASSQASYEVSLRSVRRCT